MTLLQTFVRLKNPFHLQNLRILMYLISQTFYYKHTCRATSVCRVTKQNRFSQQISIEIRFYEKIYAKIGYWFL